MPIMSNTTAKPNRSLKTSRAKNTHAALTDISSAARIPGKGSAGRNVEKNSAPSQWGRRLARLVGEKYGVQMVENHAKNEGTFAGKDICIKCAKSPMPPISVLVDMLDRIDQVWAVYVMQDQTAQIWSIDAKKVRELGYFTHGEKVQKRVEICLRHITPVGQLVGKLTRREVEACRIP